MALGEALIPPLTEAGLGKLGALFEKFRRLDEKRAVKVLAAFERYLGKAYQRYNQVRTLATGIQVRCIYGPGEIYVKIGVGKRERPYYQGTDHMEVFSTETAEGVFAAVPEGRSRNVLVLGSGGAGKSMLMRYLFLTAVRDGSHVPILLELRKISDMEPGTVSLETLVYNALKDFDADLNPEQFAYSLRHVPYLFLLDGLDEVNTRMYREAVQAVEKFCQKYPENSYIMTSRPGPELFLPEVFTVVESMPLNVEQAAELAGKLWEKDEKTVEFCRQLRDGLFEKHQSFAENPLLLSIMFLTFMRNSSIPDHLAEFYEKAYEALFSAHDTNDKSLFARDFRCKDLDETQFKMVLARFCFQTCLRKQYEFTKKEITEELQRSLNHFGFPDTNAGDFLYDLRLAVCMIVREGEKFKFCHRSFQSYFAAFYTATMPDEKQKQLFDQILHDTNQPFDESMYYILLSQIEPDRFRVNALEKWARKYLKKIEENNGSYFNFLVHISWGVVGQIEGGEKIYFSLPNFFAEYQGEGLRFIFRNKEGVYKSDYISFCIFQFSIMCSDTQLTLLTLKKNFSPVWGFHGIEIDDIIENVFRIPETRAAIREWLAKLDKERDAANGPRSLEDF